MPMSTKITCINNTTINLKVSSVMIDGFDPPIIFPHPYQKTRNSSFSPHQPSCRLASRNVHEKTCIINKKLVKKFPPLLEIVGYDPPPSTLILITFIPHQPSHVLASYQGSQNSPSIISLISCIPNILNLPKQK